MIILDVMMERPKAFLAGLLMIFVSALPGASYAVIAYDTGFGQQGKSSGAATYAAGDLLVYCNKNESAAVTSVTDTSSENFIKVDAQTFSNAGNTVFVSMWYYPNTAGGSQNITATHTGTNFDRSWAWGFSGASKSSPLDTSTFITGTTTSPVTTGSFTVKNGDALVACFGTAGGSLTSVTGTIFGALANDRFGVIGVDSDGGDREPVAAGSGTASVSWAGTAPTAQILMAGAFSLTGKVTARISKARINKARIGF